MLNEVLENNFMYHAPTPEKNAIYVEYRAKCKELAYYIVEHFPEGSERAEALKNLEQTMMWANASLARN